MKRLVALSLVGLLSSFAMASDSDLKAEIETLKQQMAELKKAQESINIDALKKQLSEVKAHDANDNIKWDVDFRTAYEHIDYNVVGQSTDTSGIWTNKLILGMAAQPLDNLVFKGALGVYKTFGNNTSAAYNPYQGMDWYGTQSPTNADIRLREAYFLYFGDIGGIPWTASFGRRPSVDGFLTNLREDNAYPASPIGHNINMEFDGASFKFDIGEKLGIEGMYLKLCLGRGNSQADARYPTYTGFQGTLTTASMMQPALPYIQNTQYDSPNMDLAGLLSQVYNDGQFKIMANYFQGWNMMGANFTRVGVGTSGGSNGVTLATNAINAALLAGVTNQQQLMGAAMQAAMPAWQNDTYQVGMTDVGDLSGGALSLQVDGLSESNDFLFDTKVFASFAWSKTDPLGKHGTTSAQMQQDIMDAMIAAGLLPAGTPTTNLATEMLGSNKSETGTSYYLGVNMPCPVVDKARIGLEYNHGSKYWRSFTYGEDTLIGSKLATRGDAYELYYNLPLLGKNLTAQLRYTYIDYKYTGSDMFFGSTGTPMTEAEAVANGMPFVDTAQSIRAYLRYRY